MYYVAVLAHSKRTREFYSPDRKRSGLLLPKSGRLTQLVEWQPVKLCVTGSNPVSSANPQAHA